MEPQAVPRIGITTDRGIAISEYENAVRAAGGEPVRLDPAVERIALDLASIDGLLVSGGDDVDAALYGEQPHPRTEPASAARDAYEAAIVQAAFARDIPTLAICRGVQIANVAFGGSLYQHVPDHFGEMISHQPQVDGTTFRGLIAAHRVDVTSTSRLAAIAGPAFVTGSRHHQAVDRIAEPLEVVARTPDGVVEALEARDRSRFWLGVQWHPESTVDLDGGESAALFRAFIEAAKQTARRTAPRG